MPDAGPRASMQIAAARAAMNSIVIHPIDEAYVTYVKAPAISSDPAGFFIQAEHHGPALFIEVDPASLFPMPSRGDLVSFDITWLVTLDRLTRAIAIDDFTVHSSGHDVSGLVQDLSTATDLVTALDSYDSEVVSLAGAVTGPFLPAEPAYETALMETAGVMASFGLLRLHLPASLRDAVDLATGCELTINATPLWRNNFQAQPSAWVQPDVTVTSCPAPEVIGAVAPSGVAVIVSFDRRVDPASVSGSGTQFSFTGGLVATGASVSGRTVTVTTTPQAAGIFYTVTVAATVADTLGAPVNPAADTATFGGFYPALVRINELSTTIAAFCDQIELRVVSGGSMDGYELQWSEDGVSGTTDPGLVTFAGLIVATNDYVVVHINPGGGPTCNPTVSGDETTSPVQFPHVLHGRNYDSAYDWYSGDPFSGGRNVLTVYDNLGGIVDAVLISVSATGIVTTATEEQAALVAAAGQWQMTGGGVPPGGFVDDDFCAHAVRTVFVTSDTTPAGPTMQRTSDADSNDKAGWTTETGAGQTWGANNVGQTNF